MAPRGRLAQQLTMNFRETLPLCASVGKSPRYFEAVRTMFGNDGFTALSVSWLAFLTGNLSISRATFRSLGGFSNEYRTWGFEHFDLGYRFVMNGFKLGFSEGARNFHIAHGRPKDFYLDSINSSAEIFARRNGKSDAEDLCAFLSGRLALEEFERRSRRRLRQEMPLFSSSTYYKERFSLTSTGQNLSDRQI
jgi:GT2 family glycosyltransferase